MRLRLVAIVPVLCLLAAAVAAGEAPRLEAGVSLLGLSVTHREVTETFIGVPATLYAAVFVTRRLALEPQIGFHEVAGGGASDHVLILTGQVDYMLHAPDRGSLYLLADATAIRSSYARPETDFGIGGGLGYRLPLGRVALRFEGKYRRYVRADVGALSAIVAAGLTF